MYVLLDIYVLSLNENWIGERSNFFVFYILGSIGGSKLKLLGGVFRFR